MIGLPSDGGANRVMVAERNDRSSNCLAFLMALACNQQNIARRQTVNARSEWL